MAMAEHDEIVEAILKAAGNPVSGVVAEQVGVWADAVVAIDAVKRTTHNPNVWETRDV
jgi:hypothetical protein